jgi:hypothetical protein
MYRLFTFLVLALCLCRVAGATETLTTDGVWWNSLTPSEKVPVMFGATSAYSTGYFQAHLAQFSADNSELFAVMDSLHWTSEQRTKYINALVNVRKKAKPVLLRPDFSGKPIKAYIDGMDYFYSNHPEASKLEFSWVFECIQNKPPETCDEVAKLARPRKE